MKKIILLFIMIFLLTGCNVEYTLTINENNIYENINIIAETEVENTRISSYLKPVEAYINSPLNSESLEKLPGVEYYEMNKSNNNELYTLNLNYNFPYEEFKKGNIINSSVSVLKIIEEDGIYQINSGANIKAVGENTINNLIIKFILDDKYETVYSNADYTLNNEFIWYINKDNYKANPITFSYQEKGTNQDEDNKPNISEKPTDIPNEKVDNTNTIILVICSFLAFILVLSLVIKIGKKYQK